MNTITSGINLSDPAPHKEPERQYYFIEKAKEYVRKEAEEAGADRRNDPCAKYVRSIW